MTRTISASAMRLYIDKLDGMLKWTRSAQARDGVSLPAKCELNFVISDAQFLRAQLLEAAVGSVDVESAP